MELLGNEKMKLIITCAIAALFTWILPDGKTWASNWEHQSMAWVLGPDGTTIRSPLETPQPTELSWSIVPVSTNDTDPSTHLKYTQGLFTLGVNFPSGVPSGMEGYKYVLGEVVDEWASVSGVTNAGYVEEDGSVSVGGVGDTNGDGELNITDRGPAAGVGHIRFMAYDSRWISSSVYAQATYIPEPGSQVDNASNNSKAGDIRFNSDSTIWEPYDLDGSGSYSDEEKLLRFRNIALHEVGHVLGFGHNNIADSVMWLPYNEWNLSAGDVEGAIAIYDRVTVPEPGTLVLLSLASLGLLRRRKQT